RGNKMLTLLWLAALELNRLAGEEQYRLLPFVGKMADLGLNRAAPLIHAISPNLTRRLLDGDYNPDKDYDENRFLSSSWESLTARLYPLLTEKIVRCFAGSDFTGRDIIAGKTPVTVYLCVPESAILGKAPLIRLILESLIGQMLDTYDAARGRNCRPQTRPDGHVVSEGRSEQAVPLLTARDISELDPDEIIAFHSNRKPIRAKRMDWRAFPILKQRRAIPPPQLSALRRLEESLLP